MPWKTRSLLEVRMRLVESALARRRPLEEICREFDVSRKTACKWLARFRENGRVGLGDRSRRPQKTTSKGQERWLKPLLAWRRRRPCWGAAKLRRQLRRDHPRARLPSTRTLQRWLTREGLTRPRPRRARPGPVVPGPGLTAAVRADQVWTVDFKWWFRTGDGVRQEPLTVRDLFSRFGLLASLLPSQDDRPVRRAMTRLFKARGLPQIIRVDNGAPFAGKGAPGLSRLSVWWLRLGVVVEFTRRARPGDNASHEQFHRCYQREAVEPPAADRRAMARRARRRLRQYNEQRPHDALKGRTPAEVYRPSRRPWPGAPPEPTCPPGWQVRRVRSRGEIKWRGRRRFIGRAFAARRVGLKPVAEGVYQVRLGTLLIGELHDRDPAGMRPARWKRTRAIKVQPMSCPKMSPMSCPCARRVFRTAPSPFDPARTGRTGSGFPGFTRLRRVRFPLWTYEEFVE